MSKLRHLHADCGQSPWLDNLNRGYLRDGTLARMVDEGIRGVTANPTILARGISSSHDYDEQFTSLIAAGRSVNDAYWELVASDATEALDVLRPVFDASASGDGFVSVEVAPDLAHDVRATIAAARWLRERIDRPNLLVKVPATAEGVRAVEALTGEGASINVTLLFSLPRYAEIIEAYLTGLEKFTADDGDPATVSSVASFFISRVDTEVDRRLETLGTDEALGLRGRAAVAQAKLAYRLFSEQFSTARWRRLAHLGADVQRPLWASTSTKNPADRDTRYVEELIGPDSVTTLPEATIAAFEDHGVLGRTVDKDVRDAGGLLQQLAALGIDMDTVGQTLEDNGVANFDAAYRGILETLDATARPKSRQRGASAAPQRRSRTDRN
ncbi:transaldolase [Kribbella sp. NPDC003557]|uniref:transaldolase n=1 Tax=Kribbella sp. NPDC003557 TaxID=3154449 RepID=UPI0033A4916A